MSQNLFCPLLKDIFSSDRQYFADWYLLKCHLAKWLGIFYLRILDEVCFIDNWYFADCHLSKCHLAKCLGTFSPLLMKFSHMTENILLIAICQNVSWPNVSEPISRNSIWSFFHWLLMFWRLPFVKMSFD